MSLPASMNLVGYIEYFVLSVYGVDVASLPMFAEETDGSRVLYYPNQSTIFDLIWIVPRAKSRASV